MPTKYVKRQHWIREDQDEKLKKKVEKAKAKGSNQRDANESIYVREAIDILPD